MADIKSPPSNPHSESASALKSSYLCYFLGALVMCVIGWFVIEGVNATAPNSPARYARIVAGVLQMILGGYVFSLAGQYRQHSLILRTLGWSIFCFNIVLMTLANYAVSATAGKAAALSKETVAEMREQSKAGRETAKALRDDAAKLKTSKHAFKRDEAGKKNDAAAMAIGASSGTVEKLEKMQASLVSTPTIEIIGEFWTMVLSFVQALIMELSNIVLMHVAGSLRRKASSGALPVDVQILELLHRVHGVPAALQAAPQLAIESKPAVPAKAAPEAAKPIYSTWTGKSVPLATLGALGALGAVPQAVQAAPIKPAAPAVQAVTPVNVNPPAPVNDYPSAVVAPVNVDPPAPVTKARKARVAHDGAVMDTGVGEHDGYRYRRALAGVKAGTMRPSRDGLFAAVGASPPTAKRYIETMAAAGEIVPNPNGRGWVLASKGGAA